jgi:hypothetical protein
MRQLSNVNYRKKSRNVNIGPWAALKRRRMPKTAHSFLNILRGVAFSTPAHERSAKLTDPLDAFFIGPLNLSFTLLPNLV